MSNAPQDTSYENLLVGYYEQSDCQFSNDNPIGQAGSLSVCNITQYLCTSSSSEIEAVEVFFEYELYFNPRANLTSQVLPYLEESMLDQVANAIGVTQCVQRRRQRRDQSLSEEQGRYAGVSLEPRDTLNKNYSSCMANVKVEATAQCVPMQGGLTVFVRLPKDEQASHLSDDEKQKIHETVSNFLHDAMDRDIFIVPTSIDKVVFIGSNLLLVSANANLQAQSSDGVSTLQVGLISGFAASILFIALLLFCCCCSCNRRRKNERKFIDQEAVIASVEKASDDDIEDGDRCLASLDSLALRQGTIEMGKSGADDVSTNTSRISKASVLSQKRTADDSDSRSDEDHADEIHERSIKTVEVDFLGKLAALTTSHVASDKAYKQIEGSSKTIEVDFLDRLAARTPSPAASQDGASIQTDDFLGVRSASMTVASQTTLLAGNLRCPTTASQRTLHAGNLGSPRQQPLLEPVSPETTRMVYTPDSFDEEIMDIISDDDSTGDDSWEERYYSDDILDGHADFVGDEASVSRMPKAGSEIDETDARSHLQMS